MDGVIEEITFETADLVVCYDAHTEDIMLLMGVEQEQCDIYDYDGYGVIIRK